MLSKINHFKKYSKLGNSHVSLSTEQKFKEQQIQIGKYNINYLKVGHGPHNINFMPAGLGSIWTNYKRQIENFDMNKFTLVAWDPPGFGVSYPPDMEFRSCNYEYTADVGYQLMKKLDIPKYSLLGWCIGGSASIILAAKHPDVVTKLVVWNANSFLLPHEIEAFRSIRDISEWSTHFKEAMITTSDKERLGSYWTKRVDGMLAAKEVNMDICTKYLKYIQCPTMVLHGDKDPLVDKIHATYLVQIVKNSILYKYPEGNHSIHMQEAKDFNRRVQDFLLSS